MYDYLPSMSPLLGQGNYSGRGGGRNPMAGMLGLMFGKGAGAFWGGPAGMALTSFGLPLLAKGLGAGRREEQAFKDWQNKQNLIMSPNWARDRMAEYSSILQQNSAGERNNILTNANAFQNRLGSNLAASGANRSGIGALAAAAGSSVAANQYSNLDSEIRRGSMSAMFRDRDALMSLLSQGPQYMENGWLDALGRGTNNYMGYMMDRNSTRGVA